MEEDFSSYNGSLCSDSFSNHTELIRSFTLESKQWQESPELNWFQGRVFSEELGQENEMEQLVLWISFQHVVLMTKKDRKSTRLTPVT